MEEDRALSADELQVRTMCQDRLCLAIKQRAAFWRQRGKQRAVREGDSNTEFFHAHATQRLRRNTIRGIEVNGMMINSHQEKVDALTAHYRGMLGTATPPPLWQFDVAGLPISLPVGCRCAADSYQD
jgi:hypothetical protein